tara:strand:- start:5877 stop:7196 length:1320 start_codon:yes stop_codon:yes gene_type:complete
VAKKSSKLNINGKSVTVETELENGAYTVKDSKGRIIGSGDSASGGNINFSGGDSTAQKELLGLSGSRSRNLNKDLQSKVKGAVENENKAILNNNASTTQKLNLRDMGYGDKLDIKGVTTPAEPDIDTTPAPSTGSDQESDTAAPSPAAPVVQKPPEVQDLDGATVRYPASQIDGNYDFVQFSIVEYVPGGEEGLKSIISTGGGGRPSGRLKNQSPVGSVILPMPLNISSQNNVNFSDDNMNAFQAGLGDIVQNAISGDVGGAVNNAMGALGANASEAKKTLRAKIAQDIVGGGNLLTRTTGAVLNSNMELLFKGPQLRTFSFDYKLTPRDKAEAQSCKQIIRMFKKAMAPKIKGGALFLYTPNVFLINFIHKGQNHPFLNKIKPCALTGLGVNFTPDGAYMTYEDGSPVAYSLQFSFSEMEPIYDIDYENDEGAEGTGF